MYNPIATYRLQFNKEFTFADFEKIIPYLQQLGVSTIYASPVFQSVPGSMHGYNSTNPLIINPEIGTEEQLKDFGEKLKAQGIGWLQDIVPNHMAFHPFNNWLMDVLEKGSKSAYQSFFDIIKGTPMADKRLMVPFLGNTLDETINKGEISIAYTQDKKQLVFKYYDSIYPISPSYYITVLKNNKSPQEIKEWIAKIKKAENTSDAKKYSAEWEGLQNQLNDIYKNGESKKYIDSCIHSVNRNKQAIQEIADGQSYRLCHWQETDKHINYRRFFTVNGLICLNIQDKEVFKQHHAYIKSLLDRGVFQGLRIDHIDGLHDPAAYLEQLRDIAGSYTYIVVEKILEQGEQIPGKWPIEGSTGYDFLAAINNLFTNTKSEEQLTTFYQKLADNDTPVEKQLHKKKAHILFEHMAGELDNLCELFNSLELADSKAEGVSAADMKKAIGAFLIYCPVYRYYGNQFPLPDEEAEAVKKIFKNIGDEDKQLKPAIDLLKKIILSDTDDTDHNQRALRFYQRCMQFTGPLMAKGMEDTLMYTYNRFIGHNDVGDTPEAFGISIDDFHKIMQHRQQHSPLSINATSTHDTKRGEDVRARLNVLTDLAGEWVKIVKGWQKINKGLKKKSAPDNNDEYFIYQTIAGAYPMPGQDDDNFAERLKAYLEKALREAKTYSTWTSPDKDYEEATKKFAEGLFNNGPFRQSFASFHNKVADFGIINSLSQILLKFTCPGVPDVYQGCELWDLNLVDPDNRRPVDYDAHLKGIRELEQNKGKEAFIQDLWSNRYNAQIKLWLTHKLLNERKQSPELFYKGQYIPLKTEGRYKDHIIAFARHHKQTWYIVAAPLHTAEICSRQKTDIKDIDWKHTRIILPDEAPQSWENLLTSKKGSKGDGILVKNLFEALPLALLKMQSTNERSAGVLLPVSSLSSAYGVGDFGPEAKRFIDFLSHSGQHYWQMLPLNPIGEGSNYSPYSSVSSMAMNILLISPDMLADDGLLEHKALKHYYIKNNGQAAYKEAEKIKLDLLNKTYNTFKQGSFHTTKKKFELFCEQEAYWLDDFSAYLVIKENNKGIPWYQWPDELKNKHPEALKKFTDEYADELQLVKWQQFIVAKQWKELKVYCNDAGIELFGDMPFYVSYDSVDVWAHPDIFCLDEQGNMTGVAGVPPDYFSADGQLWGMPTYNWQALEAQHYKWWTDRLRKNLELFDVVRIDHFRALADYWQVPAGEKTAINGKWLPGPRTKFFDAVKKELGSLPFIAEDLGDNMESAYKLRDEVGLYGMKVLQFAFGDNLPYSVDAPHNYTTNCVAYTGTHDNNTALGWYNDKNGRQGRESLEKYINGKVSDKNVCQVMMGLAYGSVARIAILPMQDILGLDETARINTPGQSTGNWQWRLQPEQLTDEIAEKLKESGKLYNRLG